MTDFSAITRCCDRLRQRVVRLRAHDDPGLADDLASIGEAFVEIQISHRALAAAVLARHYGYGIFKAQYNLLVEIAREPDEDPVPFT